ncbi:hypothetical protein [Sphingobacterium sp. FBM7-1]|uniref:hypothetical protein n=1 Tax=Sphingobacterium sp. FBM7-1 TaxID=2886688 RepID=UPI001D125C02|nr:hypothetical protein [Sphingobacterium sp. FBM7-1]MCC2598255.1 hypothetical protein [Sphingobacterium sp. FBM7-1]
MKKVLFGLLLTVSTVLSGQAQQGNIDINAGLDFGLPIGDFGDVYGFGYGATVKGLYGISEAGQVGLTLGYQRFGLKDDYDDMMSGSMGISPIFAVYRHSFGALYLEPQAGLSVNKVNLKASGGGMDFGGSASNTSFGYAAGLGYMLGNIDISARYQGLTQSGENLSFIGLRIGYNFRIK